MDPDFDYRQGADFAKPIIASVFRALNEAYDSRGDQGMRDAAVAKAAEYDADVVFERHWKPILEGMANPRKPNRAERRRKVKAVA